MVIAIIPAAGRGERFGGKTKKQFLGLDGVPVLIHTLTVFQKSLLIDQIVPVVNREDQSFTESLIARYSLSKVKKVISGGDKRQDSVRAAIVLLEKEGRPDDIVLVHDGVRPLVSPEIIDRVIHTTEEYGAAVAALPVVDSLKLVSTEGDLTKSIPRENVWAMQTPQGFHLGILGEAYRQAAQDDFIGTDDAMLVVQMGKSVKCVAGSAENIKITNSEDMRLAELIYRERTSLSPNKPVHDRPIL
jgi:2-C-methyl-D-erythritol 4-phosphate cytidylyltransferase